MLWQEGIGGGEDDNGIALYMVIMSIYGDKPSEEVRMTTALPRRFKADPRHFNADFMPF
jgi:hypothetical protein